jgi:hypothetical protein
MPELRRYTEQWWTNVPVDVTQCHEAEASEAQRPKKAGRMGMLVVKLLG